MDFLESLYSIENFGIYLFIIIGILVVLFLVVLFFGRKDQKKRKELEDVKKQFDVYKAKMESLLTAQGELLKEINRNEDNY